MKKLLLIPLVFLAYGCASDRYIVDTKGIDPVQYDIDLQECSEYKEEIEKTDGVLASAGLAGLVGTAVGGIFGDTGDALRLGGSSAIYAGSGKAVENSNDQIKVVKNCLAQRGYKVLN